MSDIHESNEQELMAKLRQALNAADPVPSDVTDFAKAALAWRTIDAELAAVAYDSSTEETPAGVRSAATAHMLSFQAGEWTIDIEYVSATARLIGQIEPSREVTVDLHFAGGIATTEADDLGRFAFDSILPGPISLVCRTPGDLEVVKTEWTVI